MRVLVTGSNRGLGLEFVRQYAERGDEVMATCRQPDRAKELRALQARFPDRMRAFLKSDAVRARRIYAGADMLLMPSAAEPCGEGQMIAMRYGSVPVVRATGGLVDTVTDYTAKRGRGTGFTFAEYTPDACQDALQRALKVYRSKKSWRRLQQRGMAADFSWESSGQEYAKLYRQAIEVRRK